ncbi:hypothetical protein [Acaryochloris marina]|uniref:hypothetical protein n=1 Tax=Acaryochloris marina TaxID=155978 RepID=UPI001BB01568|nr:hypothetical protein [Acaryochloris marina]QUY45447.1 hypothetical protein I1H34_27095 [Acaryochloris marina S15]
MNDDLELSPEIIEGAKIIQLGQSLLKLKNSLEYAREEAEASIKNAEALGRTEIATEADFILMSVKTLQQKMQNPQIQEWMAAEEEVPF